MPGIFFEPTDRRQFLQSSLLATAGLALGGCSSTRVSQSTAPGSGLAPSSASLHLALLSDTHIPADRNNEYRGFKPWENLNRIAPEVASSNPEGVIICGDAARLEGLKPDYAALKTLLEPVAAKTPVYIALGNHDDRANFNSVFNQASPLKQNVPDKHVLLLEHDAVNIVVLDSLLFVNKVPGLLGRAQRSWLADFLTKNPAKPVVLFVHHTLEDNDGDLLDTPRLFELLRAHKQVKAIFYGHSHVWERKQRDGIHLVNLPAVGYNFRDTDPAGWVTARFSRTGVDLTMHAFGGNTADDGKTFRVDWNA